MAEATEKNPNNPQTEESAEAAERRRRRAPGTRSVVDETASAIREGVSGTGEVLERESGNLTTSALIGTAVAIVEPELIPGILIGVGATLVPKLLPAVGTILRPIVKTVVKIGYEVVAGVKEVAAEVGEQYEDIVAEAQSEREARGHRATDEPELPRRPRRPQPA
jgi:hypothetical protein